MSARKSPGIQVRRGRATAQLAVAWTRPAPAMTTGKASAHSRRRRHRAIDPRMTAADCPAHLPPARSPPWPCGGADSRFGGRGPAPVVDRIEAVVRDGGQSGRGSRTGRRPPLRSDLDALTPARTPLTAYRGERPHRNGPRGKIPGRWARQASCSPAGFSRTRAADVSRRYRRGRTLGPGRMAGGRLRGLGARARPGLAVRPHLRRVGRQPGCRRARLARDRPRRARSCQPARPSGAPPRP